MKASDGSRMKRHACMALHTDIGRADPYEQVGRQPELRIWGGDCESPKDEAIGFHKKERGSFQKVKEEIARVRRTKQLAFIKKKEEAFRK